MRVKLSKDWRRWKEGKHLTGGAAKLALADKAGSEVKPKKATKKAEPKKQEL